MLLNFLDRNGMAQFVDIPARLENDTGNILDVCICNSSEYILHVETEETILSDHELVTFSLGTDFSPAKLDEKQSRPFGFSSFSFRKSDFCRLNSYILNTDWNAVMQENPESFPLRFLEILCFMCHLCSVCL